MQGAGYWQVLRHEAWALSIRRKPLSYFIGNSARVDTLRTIIASMSRTRLPVAHQRARLSSAACVALLAVALVCAQSLGLWHRMVHVGSGQPTALDQVHAAVAKAAPAPGLLAELFSHHQGDPDCLSFDHASHGDAIDAMGTVAVAFALAPHLLVANHGLFLSHWHALFHARGPPSVR